MYFEIYNRHELIKRGTELLENPQWDSELMTVPEISMKLPIYYTEWIDGREEVKLFVNHKCFWGIVTGITLNEDEETMNITLSHAVHEWNYRQISVNHAIQDKNLNIVFKGGHDTKSEINKEEIVASDLTLTQKQFENADLQFYIEKARASAWNITNGDKVKIVKVQENIITSTTKVTNVTNSGGIAMTKKQSAIVTYARQFLGTPYVWGGESLKHGIDCSGFTMKIYEHFGITLPHSSREQRKYGVSVSRDKIQPGDLICYSGHVAMYIGNGKRIHANGKRVAIDSHPFRANVITIRRIFGTKDDTSRASRFKSVQTTFGDRRLNGKEVNAEFTAYYPSASEGGFYDAGGHKLNPKNQTCAGPKSIYGKSIQITQMKGGYSNLVNKIYKVTDTGGDIQILSDGTYRIDLLMKSKRQANQFGRRKGKIIIGDGTGYTFEGSSSSVTMNHDEYKLTFSTAKGTSVTCTLKIGEEYEVESTEETVADNIGDIFHDDNFAYPGWVIDFQDDSAARMISYVYSKQTKLEALTKTLELTPDLFWRVGFINQKKVEIGKFGKKQPYILSVKPAGKTNIQILNEPTVEYDFNNVVNVATVYSDKSDSGMSSLTLREVYNDPSEQLDGFPVVILGANGNNERNYTAYITQYPKLAPNNELEYAVIDEKSVGLEGGEVIEGSYAFNDLSTFTATNDNTGKTRKISDKDRKKAAKSAYHAAIRKLKQSRRTINFGFTTSEIPADIQVGDKIRLLYDNSIYIPKECSNLMKKIMAKDSWYYVIHIGYEISATGMEVNTLKLCKEIKVERETKDA